MSASATVPAGDKLPKLLGQYELVECLPGGGMAEVYRAINTKLGKTVAVKILRSDRMEPDLIERFQFEARTIAGLRHPNVLEVYDYGEHEGRPFIVMEWLAGEDLGCAIERGRIATLPDQVQIASQIAAAIDYVNCQGILHRDIKPGNIFVCSSGEAKLIDFGIAKATASPHTEPGVAMGTIRYMAPEQVNGSSSAHIDVYAFGVVLYELIARTPAIQGKTPGEIFHNILNAPFDKVPLLNKSTPESLIGLIQACTAKRPETRPRMSAVCQQLRDLQSQVVTVPKSKPFSIPKWAFFIVPGLATLGGLYYYLPSPTKITHEQAQERQRSIPVEAKTRDVNEMMVMVPAGEALIGKKKTPKTIAEFYIDKTEVTIGAYAEYCRNKGCTPPKGDSSLPATGITFHQAQAFCEASGKRLPTAAEWEKAARGPLGFEFPWGNTQDSRRANFTGEIAPVAHYSEGTSPYGAFDMAGNVWEMVDYSQTPARKDIAFFLRHRLDPPPTVSEKWVAVYGGSYLGKQPSPLWDLALIPARYSDPTVGFRCAQAR